jgi:small subunit ribosomal protein S17
MEEGRTDRRLKQGVVVSNKMQKTCVVRVSRKFKHPMYEKIIERSKKYYAHTEEKLNVGDVVAIMETRPLSKLKCWRIVQVIEKAKEPVEVLD